jgi:sugar phosphate isomerase/epimerase
MLKPMDELDEIWQRLLDEAAAKAKTTANSDVADYLTLKAGNDAMRSAGCRWLFDSFLELSEEANRRGIRLDVENENPHRFSIGPATMVGSLLRFRLGVRNLTVEAGWTRTPADGFMRGGSLANARISHFGISKANADLMLVRQNENLAPQWFSVQSNNSRNLLSSNDLRQHFKVFTGME